MKKIRLSLILSLLFTSCILFGQDPCVERLNRAKRLYESGQLHTVLNLLTDCGMDEELARPLRREVLALLRESYLFLDMTEEADSVHLELLRLDPFFRQNTRSPEVRYLSDQYETYPVATYALRFGAYVFTRPQVDRQFQAFSDLEIQDLNYKRKSDDLYGWTINADLSFNLLRSSIEIATGVGISNIYLRRNFQFGNAYLPSGEQAPASLTFLERQRWTQLPLLLKVNTVPRSAIINTRFVPFFCIGGASEFLLKRAAQAIGPEIDFPGEANDQSASLIGIGEQRRRFNFSLLAGAGFNLRFKRTYLCLDVRYHRLLQNLSSGAGRFSNDVLLNTFNYVDSDFRLHQLNITFGAGVYLFRSKRR